MDALERYLGAVEQVTPASVDMLTMPAATETRFTLELFAAAIRLAVMHMMIQRYDCRFICLFALQELPSIQQQIDDSASTFAVLEASHHPLYDEAADMFWQLRHWPNAAQEELEAARERIWGYRNRYQLQLQEDQRQLQQDLQQLQVG
jgi:hypothetical protein